MVISPKNCDVKSSAVRESNVLGAAFAQQRTEQKPAARGDSVISAQVFKSYAPREDQKIAIDKVNQGFKKSTRGQLILPCGSGKTLTGLWVKEREQAKTTIVAVPSIALIKQTKDVWEDQKKESFDYLCICSAQDVEPGADSTHVSEQDLDSDSRKVTTEVKEIQRFLKKKSSDKVIYTTYQSLPKLIEANRSLGVNFDLALIDEAHKTTGVADELFCMVHSDQNIPIKKRLYLTATPKVLRESADTRDVLDMSNEDVFGPEFHRMTFQDAIRRKILSDYKTIVIGVTDEEIRQRFVTQNDPSGEPRRYNALIHNIALNKVMEEHGAKHAITFHPTVEEAEAFSRVHGNLFPDTLSLHVNGNQNVKHREGTMQRFAKNHKAIVSNSQCLTEGVDVPVADLVYFAAPKSSTVDIVQAIGRAIRRDPMNPNKIGYIVVPILYQQGEDIEEVIAASNYRNILDVIDDLNNDDSDLNAQFAPSGSSKSQSKSEKASRGIIIENLEDHKVLEGKVLAEDLGLLTQYEDYREQFKSAIKKIREVCPKRPRNVRSFFHSKDDFEGKGLKEHLGFGLVALKGLADQANIAKRKIGSSDLADLIWKEVKVKDFATAIEKIKTKQKQRPSHAIWYFNSQNQYSGKGLYSHIRLGFKALTRLAVEAGLVSKDSSPKHIADLIWGAEEEKDLPTVIKLIKQKYPTRPVNPSQYLNGIEMYQGKGLMADAGVGIGRLRTLISEAGLADRDMSATELADLIWGKEETISDFATACEILRKKHPSRPSAVDLYFTSQPPYKDGGLKQELGIGYVIFKRLAVAASALAEKHTNTELADLIWGKQERTESFDSIVARIKEKYPERPKMIHSFVKSTELTKHVGMCFDVLRKYFAKQEGLAKVPSCAQLADRIWGPAKEESYNLPEIIKSIKEACPKRPVNLNHYFGGYGTYKRKGLKSHAGIGLARLTAAVLASKTLSEPVTLKKLGDLIWG